MASASQVFSIVFFFILCAPASAQAPTVSTPVGAPAGVGVVSAETQAILNKWLIPISPQLQKQIIRSEGELSNFTPWTVPGSSLLTPIAYGASWGDLFGSLGIQNRARFGTLPDANAGFGFGIGNAQKWAGIEVSWSMYDVARILPWNSAGGLNVKVHSLFKNGLAFALGSVNLVQWMEGDSGQTFYGVVSKAFFLSPNEGDPFSLVFVHFGVGNGNFQTQDDIIAGRNAFNWFASAGVRLARPLSFIVNWYGSDLGVGLSIAPFRRFRLVLTPNIQDLTGSAGNGVRFMIAISFADNWRSPNFILR